MYRLMNIVIPFTTPRWEGSEVRLSEIREISGWDDFSSDWLKLQKQCGIEHPFLDWNWIRCWLERLPADGLSPLLIAVENRDGIVIALAPFQVRERLFYKILEGFAQEFCDYVDWLIAPDQESEANAAIAGWIVRARQAYSLIRISNLFPDGMAHRLLSEYLPSALTERGLAPEVAVKGNFKLYLKSLKAKFVSDTARRERKLQREVGEISYVHLSHRQEIHKVIDIIARWLSQRIKDKKEASYLDRPGMKEHFVRLYQMLHSMNMLHLTGLMVKGEFIALNVALKYRNKLFSYTPVFDSRYAKYGVMRLLKLKNIEECYQREIKTYDFCLGGEEYKFSFNPVIKQLYSLSVYGLNFQGKAFEFLERELKPRLAKHDHFKRTLKTILRYTTLIEK